MRYFYLILISLCFQVNSYCQEESYEKMREIGINVTGLIAQLAPLQTSTTLTGPFHMQFKSGRNNHFFSLKVGASVNDFFGDDNFLNLSVGYTRRKDLSKKVKMNIGYNLLIIGGSFNDPINSARQVGAIGFGWDLGFQYQLSPRIAIGTETTLFAGPTSDAFLAITFIPPIGIFLTGRLK